MNHLITLLLSTLLLATPLSSQAFFGKDDPEKERKELREARAVALEKLYLEKPALPCRRLCREQSSGLRRISTDRRTQVAWHGEYFSG